LCIKLAYLRFVIGDTNLSWYTKFSCYTKLLKQHMCYYSPLQSYCSRFIYGCGISFMQETVIISNIIFNFSFFFREIISFEFVYILSSKCYLHWAEASGVCY